MSEERHDIQKLWTAEETAKLLSCSVQHVHRLALLKQIPAIDLAPPNSKQRMWRFRPESVMQWIQEREKHRTLTRRKAV